MLRLKLCKRRLNDDIALRNKPIYPITLSSLACLATVTSPMQIVTMLSNLSIEQYPVRVLSATASSLTPHWRSGLYTGAALSWLCHCSCFHLFETVSGHQLDSHLASMSHCVHFLQVAKKTLLHEIWACWTRNKWFQYCKESIPLLVCWTSILIMFIQVIHERFDPSW